MSRNSEVATITGQLEALLDALRDNVTALNAILDPEVTGDQPAPA